ncbi:MAG: bifunctional folylpolyglutamate synthase/dihydrofolate synthase [Ruminococcaceae bacterium]|nr:bifunctional folylpolyglutamate synthase/dihydrofolate synthase [Oscillospiraceae bacterium]
MEYRKGRKEMNAQQAIEYIHSFFWKGSIPGLSRTQELLRRMGNPEKKLKFVHIAGTNGKGSTAAMTASILQKAGYKTGLYTSPYIYRFNERMQVNGEQIADEDVAAITEYVKQFAEAMEEKPTEFELVTAIGFEYFLRQGCDIVVLEVGMGGALDSTNVIEVPEVAVITNIGLDHTDYLGDTVEKIAETKAGIFKEGGAAVVYRGTAGVEEVFEKVCKERNMTLKKADFDSLKLRSHSLEGQVFDCGSRKELFLPLLGDHQLHNASVVLSIADTLIEKGWHITEQNIRDGIRDVSWPGRFDIVGRNPLFIIDGGHNPQCIDALVKNCRDYLADRKIIALTGVLADKDYGEMYRPMLPYIQEFVCITPPNPRKLDATELAEHLRRVGATATPCGAIAEGVQLAIEKAGSDGVVLCFGSLYTIGDIKNALR